MANKTLSIQLEGGVVANFQENGMIELVQKAMGANGLGNKVSIHTTDLEAIRETAKRNGRIEANGTLDVNNKGKTTGEIMSEKKES